MSLEENLPDLRQIASEKDANKNLLRLLCNINEELLNQLIHLLKPFEEATKVLSADKVPSLHLVLPSKYRLQCHLSLLGTDSTIINQMNKHLAAQLERYFHVSDLHAAATLLDPRLKNNASLMSANPRDRAIATIRQMMLKHVEGRQRRKQTNTLRGVINQQDQNNDYQTKKVNDYEDSDSEGGEDDCSDLPRKKVKISSENKTTASTSSSFFGDPFASQPPTVQVDQLDDYLNS